MIGKNIIVFGGSGVIGGEICKLLNAITPEYKTDAYQVFNADLNDVIVPGVEFMHVDLLNGNSVKRAFDQIIRTHGPIYAVINCTYPKPKRYMQNPWSTTTDGDYLTFFNLHLISNLSLCKFAMEYNVKNVILLSSIYGAKIPEDWIYENSCIHKTPLEYCMAKSAINQLVRYVSKDIHINAIAPGGIESDSMDATFKTNYRKRAEFTKVNEIAGMVAYLLSDDGQGINGQVITVDGGFCR